MPPVISSRSRVAVAIARAVASANGPQEMTAEHLLLGLILERDNPVVAALLEARVDLDALRRDVYASLHACAATGTSEILLPVTDGETHLLQLARDEAAQRQSPVVWGDHLMFAIFRDAQPALLNVLARHNVSLESMTHYLTRVRPAETVR